MINKALNLSMFSMILFRLFIGFRNLRECLLKANAKYFVKLLLYFYKYIEKTFSKRMTINLNSIDL
jgi:hypothetical protein